MPAPHSEVDAPAAFDCDVSDLASSRRKGNHLRATTRGKSISKFGSDPSPPGVVKRIFAALGIVVGVCIVLFGAYGLMNGHMRAGRAIGGGLVLASVSFGWLLGSSN